MTDRNPFLALMEDDDDDAPKKQSKNETVTTSKDSTSDQQTDVESDAETPNKTEKDPKQAFADLIGDDDDEDKNYGQKVLDKVRDVANKVGDVAKDSTEEDLKTAGAGAVAGLATRKAVELKFPGSTGGPENELQYKQNLKDLEKLKNYNPATDYQNTAKNLMEQRNIAQEKFNQSQRQLENAFKTNMLIQNLGINEFLPPEFRTTPSAPESVLNRQPIGGEATSKYAQKFGLTPLESLDAPSMSKVQKSIPNMASSIERAQQVGPGFQKFAESPLLLGPEGQKYASEQKSDQDNQQKARAVAEEDAKRQLAQQKAQMQFNLDNAQKAHDSNMKALRDANKAIDALTAKPEPIDTSDEKNRLQKETDRYGGASKAGQMLGYMGRKIFPRANPVLAGAVLPEQAEAAYKAYKANEYGKMAAHGAGALGSALMMTGNPPLSGAGMLLNLPSAYYGAEEFMNGEPAKP